MTPFGFGRSRRRGSGFGGADKPVLAVDIDGVVLLHGFDEPPGWPAATLEMIDGMIYPVVVGAGDRLRELSKHFDLVWASGWERRSNLLSPLLGMPERPYLSFGGAARFGSADWKLNPLSEYAKGRALAWIDDSFDDSCYEWVRVREEPTLLVPTESERGIQDEHVAALVGWARSLRADPQEAAEPG
jgi:hypothetical protein